MRAADAFSLMVLHAFHGAISLGERMTRKMTCCAKQAGVQKQMRIAESKDANLLVLNVCLRLFNSHCEKQRWENVHEKNYIA